jgi:hypothetical protein
MFLTKLFVYIDSKRLIKVDVAIFNSKVISRYHLRVIVILYIYVDGRNISLLNL